MPIYIHPSNLVITKNTVNEKYTGGVRQFRQDFNIPSSEMHQENNELFSLSAMNADEFDIYFLISHGLHFDEAENRSEDFVILNRYGGFLWETDWLKHNGVFAWHIHTDEAVIKRVEEICEMSMDDILEAMERGNNLFRPITAADVVGR